MKWQDILRPVAECTEGVRIGGLVRWFDNNTFYRQPIINGKLRWRRGEIGGYVYRELLGATTTPKVVLPSPFSYAELSDNRHYQSEEKLVEDVGRILNECARELAELGIKHVQFSEPVAVATFISNDEKNLIHHALKIATEALNCGVSLHTFFGDLSTLYPEALDWPIDALGADFYATTIGSLKQFKCSKPLIAGCVDGRNSLLEDPSMIAQFVKDLVDYLKPSEVILAPNCDLEFLPRPVAEEKMRRLRAASSILEGTQ